MPSSYLEALNKFCDTQTFWTTLPFFRTGAARNVCTQLDEWVSNGSLITPDPAKVFRALELTAFDATKVLLLGQDPYPKIGDADGLAFSYSGSSSIPASLRMIIKEIGLDTRTVSTELSSWAHQGVCLLNTSLTCFAGHSHSHSELGWSVLVEEVFESLNYRDSPCGFILLGNHAKHFGRLINNTQHHCFIAGHPSPLNRNATFRGCKIFDQVNQWLESKHIKTIQWGCL